MKKKFRNKRESGGKRRINSHVQCLIFQYLVSGRSWAIVDRQPAVAVPSESSGTETHIVATLPYARHAFLPSAPNIPKSATATWGHLNKNLMWKVTNWTASSQTLFNAILSSLL